MKRYQILGWIGLLVLVVTAIACTSNNEVIDQEAVSAITQEEAMVLAENAMQGFKDGDYAMWARDWSDAMKGAINEETFLAFRQELTAQMGTFQSIESVTIAPGNNEGFVRWVAVTTFEKGQVEIAFSFQQDGKLIEGVFPRPLS